MTIQNFSMTAGTSKTITASVDNFDLSIGSSVFLIKSNGSLILSKDNTDETFAGLTFSFIPSDTQGLVGDYDYEINYTDELGNVTNLFEGTFSFRKSDGVTAQQVFTMAMDLMDVITQDGTFNGYPSDYKRKAWSILTVLQSDLTPATTVPTPIVDETSAFSLDDRSALMILPYGLAAHLLLTEDMNRASFFNNRYDELKRKRPAQIVPINDVLGITRNGPTSQTTPAPALITDIYGGSDF